MQSLSTREPVFTSQDTPPPRPPFWRAVGLRSGFFTGCDRSDESIRGLLRDGFSPRPAECFGAPFAADQTNRSSRNRRSILEKLHFRRWSCLLRPACFGSFAGDLSAPLRAERGGSRGAAYGARLLADLALFCVAQRLRRGTPTQAAKSHGVRILAHAVSLTQRSDKKKGRSSSSCLTHRYVKQ